jgi:hypothetical protein
LRLRRRALPRRIAGGRLLICTNARRGGKMPQMAARSQGNTATHRARGGSAAVSVVPPQRFGSFREFYPYYLQQHCNPVSRRLHVVGTLVALAALAAAAATRHWGWLLGAAVAGYLPAWAGHLFFEHNRPATFRHPLYSLWADLRMLGEVLSGRRPW